MEFSDDELALIAVLLNLQVAALHQMRPVDQEAGRRRRRRYGVHPLWRIRETEGELILFKQLLTDDEDRFYRYFRMSRDCFATLLRKIESQVVKKYTHFKSPITPEERLAVCLRYLSTGDSLKTISYNFRMGYTTVKNIVKETCRAITKTLLPETIPKPSMEMWERIRQQFWEKYRFPNCLGAIGGKRMTIPASANSGSLYCNYKETYSIVLMAVADANSNFIAIEVGPLGKNSDGGIFAQSKLGRTINDGSYRMLPDTNLPGTSTCTPCVFVGDEAFPLKRNMLRPFPENQAEFDHGRTHFNARLANVRRVVENAFAILAQTFGIYNRRIHVRPENIDCIVMATCVLHNFIRMYQGSRQTGGIQELLQQEEEAQSATWNALNHHGENSSPEALDVRDKFKDYIVNKDCIEDMSDGCLYCT